MPFGFLPSFLTANSEGAKVIDGAGTLAKIYRRRTGTHRG